MSIAFPDTADQSAASQETGSSSLTSFPLLLDSAIRTTTSQPVTVGLPFPRGMLHSPEHLRLCDENGQAAPLQAACLARWSDGSVKWLLFDFIFPGTEDCRSTWMMQQVTEERSHEGPRLRIEETQEAVIVDAGATEFYLSRRVFQPFARVVQNGRDVLDGEATATTFTDARGHVRLGHVETMTIETKGPIRATVRIEGTFPRARGLRFVARLSFYAGTDLVRLAYTIHNPNRARHRGGLWDLGDARSILFRDLSLALTLTHSAEAEMTWIAEPGHTPQSAPAARLEIYQDSSGGDNWQSRNHVNRHGRVPCSFRGYRLQAPQHERLGLRANPVVSLANRDVRVTVAVPEFWQQFPKSLEVAERTLRIRLFPQQFADLFELQGGEQKTHTVWLDFRASGSADELSWVHSPMRVHAAPEWYASSEAIPFLPAGRCELNTPFESILAGAIRGPSNLFERREIIDEHGWRNFGELYADHEGAHYPGPPPVISHYNNQYDVLYGAILQFLRTCDVRWVDLFSPLARHVIDIDIYHTKRDRAAYNGGLFWHTDHYRDAATATHRAYSKANQRPGRGYGGGPCNEHCYSTGLLHYYFLTGDPAAERAVISLAEWIMGMDDGSKNVLGVIDDGPIGAASSTRDYTYHGPGRGCGNAINTLLDGWLLTGCDKYLAKAEKLIRRAIHPADDIPARNLLDCERRWSYTVFLSVLSRYLQIKRENDRFDQMYAYARAGLLHYAQWMLEHECPYLDHPENLEFPTETWAAQDLRKANVLRLAAAHAEGSFRVRLLRRAAELADGAWSSLMRFASHSVTRSLALIMSEGTRDCFFRRHGVAAEASPLVPQDFGKPVPFTPQRTRVLRQLKNPLGLARAFVRVVNPKHWRKLFLPL